MCLRATLHVGGEGLRGVGLVHGLAPNPVTPVPTQPLRRATNNAPEPEATCKAVKETPLKEPKEVLPWRGVDVGWGDGSC